MEDATDEIRRLVAMVTCSAAGQDRIGAGVLFGADGTGLHIATADHVVRGCRQAGGVRVLLRDRPDSAVPAVVLPATDTVLGLAVLRVRPADMTASIATLPFDRVGSPDDEPERNSYYRDEAIAVTFQHGSPWHFNRAYDLRTDAGDAVIRYQSAGLDPGRIVPDSVAPGHAGGALFSRNERLLVGMIISDDPDRRVTHNGRAIRIDVVVDRARGWGLPVNLAAPAAPDTFSALAIGSGHMCGLAAGTAFCWGANRAGQLGNGTASARPSRVLGRLRFRDIRAADNATCGLTVDGAVYCWGAGAPGLPTESPDTASLPRRVADGHRFAALALGGAHACGLTSDGTALCWGGNEHGQLGNGSRIAAGQPVPVAGGHRFTAIAAGGLHTCALTAPGAAFCWGNSSAGAVGNGSTDDVTTPAPVAGGRVFTAIAASGDGHTCGITASGAAFCWGRNDNNRLGSGPWGNDAATPVAVAGHVAVASIAAGSEATCGLADGVTWCWGGAPSLQAADDERRGRPVTVAGAPRFASLAVTLTTSGRSGLTCGLTQSGEAYCWGSAVDGQAGPTFGERGRSDVPLRIRPARSP